MKHYFLFFFIIFSSPLFAQKDSLSRFQVSVNAIPEMNFRKLTIITGSGGTIAKPGITLGVNASYYFTNHFSLETGLNYAFRNYQINDNIDNIERPDPAFPEIINHHLKFQHLEIPVIANFFSTHKKIRLVTSLGISTNFFLNLKEEELWIYPDKVVEWDSPFNSVPKNKISFSPLMACGIDYKISDKVNLRVQPTARFAIQDKNSVIKVFSTEINLGTYYSL